MLLVSVATCQTVVCHAPPVCGTTRLKGMNIAQGVALLLRTPWLRDLVAFKNASYRSLNTSTGHWPIDRYPTTTPIMALWVAYTQLRFDTDVGRTGLAVSTWRSRHWRLSPLINSNNFIQLDQPTAAACSSYRSSIVPIHPSSIPDPAKRHRKIYCALSRGYVIEKRRGVKGERVKLDAEW